MHALLNAIRRRAVDADECHDEREHTKGRKERRAELPRAVLRRQVVAESDNRGNPSGELLPDEGSQRRSNRSHTLRIGVHHDVVGRPVLRRRRQIVQ